MALPPQFLEELRNRVSLAAVVGRRVRLTRKGKEFMGLCPFHNEKTPSFSVVEDKGFYHCFGCGAHGDVLSFVMQTEGATFPEAVEKLAAEAGMEVPKVSPQAVAEAAKRKTLYEVTEAACRWFESELISTGGEEARRYLMGRGLKVDTIRRFRLGFAPNRRGALMRHLKTLGIDEADAIAAGLVKKDEEGRLREYFFDRIIFPITDKRKRIVAFGGRTLGDGQPKYLNSPDGVLFHKGQLLYNLAAAAESARRDEPIVVVEGYMDVIALVEAGVEGAVAPLGTAITEDQLVELWRLRDVPTICMDGDAAGYRAAWRAAERALPLLEPGKSLAFVFLPSEDDPDSFVRRRGAAALSSAISSAKPLSGFIWSHLRAAHSTTTPEERAALLRDAMTRAGLIRNHIVSREYSSFFKSQYYNNVVNIRDFRKRDESNVSIIKKGLPSKSEHSIEGIIYCVTIKPDVLFTELDTIVSLRPAHSEICARWLRLLNKLLEGYESETDVYARELKSMFDVLRKRKMIQAKFQYPFKADFRMIDNDARILLLQLDIDRTNIELDEAVASFEQTLDETTLQRIHHLRQSIALIQSRQDLLGEEREIFRQAAESLEGGLPAAVRERLTGEAVEDVEEAA